MIAFQDFAPTVQDWGDFLSAPVTEQMDGCLRRANDWITEQSAEVLNVETVVLPNMYSPGEKGSGDTLLKTTGESASFWYQFVRVWYRVRPEVSA